MLCQGISPEVWLRGGGKGWGDPVEWVQLWQGAEDGAELSLWPGVVGGHPGQLHITVEVRCQGRQGVAQGPAVETDTGSGLPDLYPQRLTKIQS